MRRAQRLEAVGQLTGGVAHDFNNLLTVVMGDGELLAEMLPDDHPGQDLVAMSGNAAKRGAALTARLLAFSRRKAPAPKPTDVAAALARLAGTLRRTLSDGVALEIECEPGLGPALVDRVQRETALLNLALNAGEAMPGGGALRISAGASRSRRGGRDTRPTTKRRRGDDVAIVIADSGEGMAPEVLAKAVAPFFSTKPPGEGRGLGLSQVYGFARQSRGWLSLRSTPARGTVALLNLPRVAASSEDDDLVGAPSRAGTGETVLVVEDDDLLRQHVATVLRRLGYRALLASDGAEATRVFAAKPEVDALFSDIVKPGDVDGWGCAGRGRAP